MPDANRRLPVIVRPAPLSPALLTALAADIAPWGGVRSYTRGPCAPSRQAVLTGQRTHWVDIVV